MQTSRDMLKSAAPSTEETPFAALRRFAQPPAPVEWCELCSLELSVEHRHMVEPSSQRLVCACDACAVLFDNETTTKYRSVPRDSRSLPGFRLDDTQWASLMIPIGLAFFYHSSAAERVVAIYPSPAGPTESPLDAEAWHELVRDNPVLEEMEPDTQALLVNRVGDARGHYLAPIDRCYRLVGLIRTHWQGFTGGDDAWEAIGDFFSTLEEQSIPLTGDTRA